MAMAQETIEEKVLKWPATERIRLAEKLMASVDDFAAPEIQAAWNDQIEARVLEIREGHAAEVPVEDVMKEVRRKLHETRRLPPVGRRRTR